MPVLPSYRNQTIDLQNKSIDYHFYLMIPEACNFIKKETLAQGKELLVLI